MVREIKTQIVFLDGHTKEFEFDAKRGFYVTRVNGVEYKILGSEELDVDRRRASLSDCGNRASYSGWHGPRDHLERALSPIAWSAFEIPGHISPRSTVVMERAENRNGIYVSSPIRRILDAGGQIVSSIRIAGYSPK